MMMLMKQMNRSSEVRCICLFSGDRRLLPAVHSI
jgi:uncharacterized LabA/DUF88 family protein